MNITQEEFLMILGGKELELYILRKQITELESKIKLLVTEKKGEN